MGGEFEKFRKVSICSIKKYLHPTSTSVLVGLNSASKWLCLGSAFELGKNFQFDRFQVQCKLSVVDELVGQTFARLSA